MVTGNALGGEPVSSPILWDIPLYPCPPPHTYTPRLHLSALESGPTLFIFAWVWGGSHCSWTAMTSWMPLWRPKVPSMKVLG